MMWRGESDSRVGLCSLIRMGTTLTFGSDFLAMRHGTPTITPVQVVHGNRGAFSGEPKALVDMGGENIPPSEIQGD